MISLVHAVQLLYYHIEGKILAPGSYPSLCVHSRLGPSTIAMFPGVILFTSWYSVSLERNLIKYLLKQLQQKGQKTYLGQK